MVGELEAVATAAAVLVLLRRAILAATRSSPLTGVRREARAGGGRTAGICGGPAERGSAQRHDSNPQDSEVLQHKQKSCLSLP